PAFPVRGPFRARNRARTRAAARRRTGAGAGRAAPAAPPAPALGAPAGPRAGALDRPEDRARGAGRGHRRPPGLLRAGGLRAVQRSEEHTSELQSREKLVCRRLPEKKNIETVE